MDCRKLLYSPIIFFCKKLSYHFSFLCGYIVKPSLYLNFFQLVNPNNKDIRDIPGLAPPAMNRKLLWNPYWREFEESLKWMIIKLPRWFAFMVRWLLALWCCSWPCFMKQVANDLEIGWISRKLVSLLLLCLVDWLPMRFVVLSIKARKTYNVYFRLYWFIPCIKHSWIL